MQNIIDTRVLKKFGQYVFSAICIFGGFALISYGGLWLSFHYFDSPAPYIFGLLGTGLLFSVYQIAKERVAIERNREQRELEYIATKLQQQEERAKWREDFYQKYGHYPTTP